MQQPDKRVVVVGAGVIGASISYHLAHLSQPCTVIEQCAIACAASGKSGGFLAKDWCDTSPLKKLARPSFHMHEQLSEQLASDIGYRKLQSYSISLVHRQSPTAAAQGHRRGPVVSNLSWLDGAAAHVHPPQSIGTTSTNAQLLPRRLTNAFLDNANKLCSSTVLIGKVEDVKLHENKVTSVSIRDPDGNLSSLQCDVIVLAMGPWSTDAMTWFPQLPPVIAQKAASLVIKAEIPATALFTEYVNARGHARSPEAYPRQGEVYLCQSAVAEDLPSDPATISIDDQDLEDLKDFARALSTQLDEALNDDANIVAQACNLPVSPDGLPIIGEVPGSCGSAFIATGHSCWGILNSPATGKAIAELIVNGTSSIDISDFCPSRFGGL